MTTPIFITGDDISVPITLTKNGVTFTISNSAIVKTRLVTTNHGSALSEDVTQSHLTAGANWAASLLVVVLGSAATVKIAQQGLATLEIQVDDGGKTTWFVDVQIVRGQIA